VIVSAGGTGAYLITGQFPGITEVEAGSYVTMETCYRKIGIDFHCARSILTTVISRPDPQPAVVDAGLKAMSTDARRDDGSPRGREAIDNR
jgi:D-serine deaminase-like pyridoxal phosphate-dependent protein